ncbi:MAG: hypothetical protein JWP97_4254 [Labilithrix sp.]|nr:hypothetical protein [Labilithrix sp.]
MRSSVVLAGAALVVSLAACSSTKEVLVDDDEAADAGARDGSTYDSAAPPGSGLGELLFRPGAVFTGSDGTHAFQVPVAVYDADADLTVTVADESLASVARTSLVNPTKDGVTDSGQYFLVSARKAGTVTLTATSRGRSTTATVTITAYDPSRYAVGEARYQAAGTGADRPCTSCHAGDSAVDHSSAALGTASDQEIGVIITTGVKPGPSVIKIGDGTTQHRWNVTDAQKDGLITYLRSLPPRGFQ